MRPGHIYNMMIEINAWARPLRFEWIKKPLIISLALFLLEPLSVQAQIIFGEKTAELEQLETIVNLCSKQQTISSCHAALSRSHVIQLTESSSPDPAMPIMRNAVMLLPLYMLAELYEHEDRQDLSCGFAQSGKRQLDRLFRDIDTLMAKDSLAFKNIDETKHGLSDIGSRFDKVLQQCN